MEFVGFVYCFGPEVVNAMEKGRGATCFYIQSNAGDQVIQFEIPGGTYYVK